MACIFRVVVKAPATVRRVVKPPKVVRVTGCDPTLTFVVDSFGNFVVDSFGNFVVV